MELAWTGLGWVPTLYLLQLFSWCASYLVSQLVIHTWTSLYGSSISPSRQQVQLYSTNFSCCVTLLALYLYYVTASPKAILLAHFFQGLISGMTIDRGCSWTPTWTPPDSPDLLACRVFLALSLTDMSFPFVLIFRRP